MSDRTRRWVIVVLLHCYGALIGATAWSKGVFFPQVVKEFGLTHAAAAAILSVNTVLGGGVSLLCGWLLIRRVPPEWYLMVTTTLVGVGYAVASLATRYEHLVLAYVIVAAGAAHLVVVPFIINGWFSGRRGLALGISMTGSTTGGMALTPLMAYVVALWGWRFGFQCLAVAIGLVLAPLMLLFIRSGPQAVLAGAAHGAETASAGSEVPGLTLRQALRTPHYATYIALYFIFWASTNAYLLHFISALISKGLSSERAAFTMSAIFALAAVTKLIFGYLSDRVNSRTALAASFVMSCAGLAVFAVFLLDAAPAALISFVVLYGLSYSAPLILFPLLITRTFGRKHFTLIDSTVMVTGSVCGATGSVFAGWVWDKVGNYWPAFLTFSLALAAAAAVLLLLPKRKEY